MQVDGAVEARAELDLGDAARPAPRPARRTPPASPARHAPRPASARRRSAAATAARSPPRRRSGGRASGRVSGSSSSKPASVSASSAASSTERANTPTWSSVRDSSSAPVRGIRPCVGLKPTTPQKAAGRITEPLVCEPIAPGTMPRRDRRRRAARRAARRALRVVRIAGLAGMEVGVFGGHGLAHDHGAGRAQPRHRRRIAARRAAGPQRRAELGRHVAGVEDVLDADRHAVQRAGRPGPACDARRQPRPAAARGRGRGTPRPGPRRSTSSMRSRQSPTSSAERDAALADVGRRLASAPSAARLMRIRPARPTCSPRP